MFAEFLLPPFILELHTTRPFRRLPHAHGPGSTDLLVSFLLVEVILVVLPFGEAVDDLCCTIEKLERLRDLCLDRWQKMGYVVREGVEELEEGRAYSIVGVI